MWKQSCTVLLQHEIHSESQDATQVDKDEKPAIHSIRELIDINRYSSLDKLLRVTALVLRFVTATKGKDENCATGSPSPKEIKEAENVWIKTIQAETFDKEIAALSKKSTVKEPLVTQLRLFLDGKGILRLGGRLHNAPIDYSTKFPALLPRNHEFTHLLIRHAHFKVFHAGIQSTVTHIRQRYWIPSIREAVKAALRKCVTCKKVNGKSYDMPVSPPLQSCRVNKAPPFTVTGVDFTGTLYVTNGSHANEGKAYICLFTCAVTRAIHLEVVTNLSTVSFLNAFRRFAARGSLPTKMISDNAMTYVNAAEEITNLLNSREIKDYMNNHRVEWMFIPKRAPWFGGFWERLIGLTKTTLKKVLGRAHITLDELTTLTEVETILNDRPITYASDCPDDYEPLTPSLLLHGRLMNTLPYELIDDDTLTDPTFTVRDQTTLVKRKQHLANLHEHFWHRWSSEYLPALHERHNPNGKTNNTIQVGDVVLIQSDDKRRVNWNLALVLELRYGNDGLVRSAKIKTKGGQTNRPINKLYPLELTCDDPRNSTGNVHIPKDTANNNNQIVQKETRPIRQAAISAKNKIKNWTRQLQN
ncbi:uncharacterized protein LOC144433645 [Glandiceps talaboti]